MKTLKEKIIKTLNDKLEPSKNGLYFGEDIKQFMSQLEEFIDDKRMIQSSGEGTNVEIIRFFEFEWQEFKDKHLGDEEWKINF